MLSDNWMKSSCRCSKGQRKEFEASRDKNSFPRIMELAGQMFLVDNFYSFMKASPSMSIYNLNHLECTMVDEGMQEPKKCVLFCFVFPRKPGRTMSQLWVSHGPDCSFNLQPSFTHLNSSDSGVDFCHVTRIWGWRSLAMRGYSLLQSL